MADRVERRSAAGPARPTGSPSRTAGFGVAMGAAGQHGFFGPARPRVFAHRGLTFDVPENTIAAFRRATDIGAQYIETDSQVTSDGVAVLFHDDTLERITGDSRPIDSMTLRQLQAIDLGGDRVPTVAEALDAFPETRFNIDVKAAGAAIPVARAVVEADAQDRVLVTSFSEQRRLATVAIAGSVATSPGLPLMARALPFAVLGDVTRVRRLLGGVDAVQVPRRFHGIPVVTRRSVATMHRAGIEVHVWTVNDEPTMRELLDLGVDGLVTDRADLALAVVASRN
ncbi:glycerophosphodiester phosphodiesterase [Plantibacter sp. Mn2098]|uniref:glycerophosphodiester phosphodiesterase n=1 Tax=Plantibacter sp. Mn2098 TaxID=3395266 RepID=UPI003BC25F61